jgi:hypothetical protein
MYSTVSDSALHTSIMIGSTMIRTCTYYTPHLPPLVVGEGLVGDEMDGLHDPDRQRGASLPTSEALVNPHLTLTSNSHIELRLFIFFLYVSYPFPLPFSCFSQ